jgi:carbon monoxide dehydrogenase subunit G
MATAYFEQTIDVRVPPEAVHTFLTDLHRYRALHPLIERIEDLPSAPERPGARRYRVIDRLRFGPLRFRTAYIAEVEPTSPTEVHGTAWQNPGVEVHTRYRVSPSPEGTTLREEAVVKAPCLLLGYVRRQARAAHRETLEKLKTHLERG